MKQKMRTLKRLKTVREHLRNAAAAERAVAEGQWHRRNQELAEARERHLETSQLLSDRLKHVENVGEIETIRAQLAASRDELLRARQALVESRLIVDGKCAELQRCERSLRTSERILARAAGHLDARRRRIEQREHDDMSAARQRSRA